MTALPPGNTDVEVPPIWRRKSSACLDDHCVEVAFHGDRVEVANSDVPAPYLAFTPTSWQRFTTGLRSGSLRPGR
ncbi:DUF397 domain-containing protein [Micromonospora sp. LOL_023]|uniref:DUF397 domain-containing protein n=1 Tax=Micromonospora sp. LOL_023 TaxID=3345418 RepID=UPI003A836988